MESRNKFIYLPVQILNLKIAALVDTGSSINVISQQLFNSIPETHKSWVNSTSEKIVLANNQSVNIIGVSRIKIQIPQGKHWILVHVFSQTSHPLLLGTDYLVSKKIMLDFSKLTVCSRFCKVKNQKRLSVLPNSEMIVWGKVHNDILHGMQGICTNHNYLFKLGVLTAKSVVSVNKDKLVPVKLFNSTNEIVDIPRGQIVAKFEILDNDSDLIATCIGNRENPEVNNVQFSTEKCEDGELSGTKFFSYFDIPKHLSESEQGQLKGFLKSHDNIFVTDENPALGFTDVVQHKIILKPDFKPKYQRSYRLTPDKKQVLRDHLDHLLKQGIISPVGETEDIPITSPIVLVSKRAKESRNSQNSDFNQSSNSLSQFRFCCDFRYLNSQSQQFFYGLPELQDLTESFSNRTPNFITHIDLSSGFFQMPISPDSQRYTAFNTCYGTYQFLRLPMGLSSSPGSFQLLMDKVLHGLTFNSCLCYLDDVLITSETFEQHLSDLHEVFNRLQAAGLKLGPKKCHFAQKSCLFLGHLISKDGIQPPPDRITAVQEYPSPRSVRELRRALGLLNWFKKFIPNFSAEIEPLTKLLRKNAKFRWTSEQENAFTKLKSLLTNSPILAFPNFHTEFYLAVDTSSKGIGYMLYQYQETASDSKDVSVIRFGSKSLSKWQRSYGPTKLELLGMVTAILDCAMYLRGRKFIVECDHQALRPIFQKQLKGAIYERWVAILQQFNFELRYKPAKDMQVADALSRSTRLTSCEGIDSPDQEDPFFPYVPEHVGDIQFEGKRVKFPNFMDSESTDFQEHNLPEVNNVMQSHDSIRNLKHFKRSKQFQNKQLDFGYDADTEDYDVADQTISKIKSQLPDYIKYQQFTDKCDSEDRNITADTGNRDIPETSSQNIDTENQSESVDHKTSAKNQDTEISTEKEDHSNFTTLNTDGDETQTNLSTETATSENNTQVKFTDSIEIFRHGDFSKDTFQKLQVRDPYFGPFISYFEQNKLPSSQKAARKLLLETPNYDMVDGLLFHTRTAKCKRTKLFTSYQLALPEVAIKTVLRLYHDSPLGGHGGIQHTADMLKEHYYFPKLLQSVTDYVRSCHDCQSRKVTQVKTKAGIVAFKTPEAPFQVWQMDLYGPVPVSAKGNSYIFTAVDAFTKFLVAEPIPNKDALTVAEVLFKLVSQYGVCDTLISDRGSEATARAIKEVCRLLEINQQYTPSFTHHCLGLCERTHRTFAERMTPYIQQGKHWEDMVPSILFSLNSTANDSVKYSPFEILYGSRPKFPLSGHVRDLNLASIPKDYHDYLKQFSERLDIIRNEVKDHALKSQTAMMERANQKVHNLTLRLGDFVYMSKDPTGPGHKFKFKFAGPYVVENCESPHLYTLKDQTTSKIFPSIHINRLKPAYVRKPNQCNYFMDPVITNVNQFTVEHDLLSDEHSEHSENDSPCNDLVSSENKLSNVPDVSTSENNLPVRRSKRTHRKPMRFRDTNFTTPESSTDSHIKDNVKIKRILACKIVNGTHKYLVHLCGEPAQNARWMDISDLNVKAKEIISKRPPPIIN